MLSRPMDRLYVLMIKALREEIVSLSKNTCTKLKNCENNIFFLNNHVDIDISLRYLKSSLYIHVFLFKFLSDSSLLRVLEYKTLMFSNLICQERESKFNGFKSLVISKNARERINRGR